MYNSEKLPEGELTPQSEFGKKLDNFWYYNKWKVIGAIFVLAILAICLFQCMTRETYDLSIVYGGAMSASDERSQAMRAALSDVEPDGIGDKGIGLTVLEIYGEDYAKEHQNSFNSVVNNNNYTNLCQLITAGEYSILILDRWIYEDIKGNVGFRAIDEVCGEGTVSEDQKYDATAVYLKKTAFYGSNAGAFSGVSDDAVICVCIYSPFKAAVGCGGVAETDPDYQKAVDMFRAILTYRS